METLETLAGAQDLIAHEKMLLLYLSRPDCGVCTAIKPKVEEMLSRYPKIRSGYIDLDQLPAAAGEFSVFTIPAVLVYTDGKESVREARYISMEPLEEKIRRPYELLFD